MALKTVHDLLLFSQICIVIGVLLTIIGTIGGLRQIILDAKNYKLYS